MRFQAIRTIFAQKEKNHPQQSARQKNGYFRQPFRPLSGQLRARWCPCPQQGRAGSTHSVLHAHSLEGIVSLGCFPGEHDAVCAVQDSVGNVAALSTGRARLLDHAFQHLGENKPTGINTLPEEVAAPQYSLWLGQKVGCNLRNSRSSPGVWKRKRVCFLNQF